MERPINARSVLSALRTNNSVTRSDWYGKIYQCKICVYCDKNTQLRGEFNNASARRALVDWYLSLFIMCKAWHQYNERPRALALLNSPLLCVLTQIERSTNARSVYIAIRTHNYVTCPGWYGKFYRCMICVYCDKNTQHCYTFWLIFKDLHVFYGLI